MASTTGTTFGRFGRFGRVMLGALAAFSLALLLAGSMVSPAGAADNNPRLDKSAFKAGCESGGGSYVENPDGSFQCNLKDGGTIKCPDTTSPCSYTPKLVVVSNVLDTANANVGNLQVAGDPGVTTTTHPSRIRGGSCAVLRNQDDDL